MSIEVGVCRDNEGNEEGSEFWGIDSERDTFLSSDCLCFSFTFSLSLSFDFFFLLDPMPPKACAKLMAPESASSSDWSWVESSESWCCFLLPDTLELDSLSFFDSLLLFSELDLCLFFEDFFVRPFQKFIWKSYCSIWFFNSYTCFV